MKQYNLHLQAGHVTTFEEEVIESEDDGIREDVIWDEINCFHRDIQA